MAINVVDNQAVKLYTPSETRFNEKTSECEWHLPYYQMVTCDDVTEILVETTDDEVELQNDGTFSYAVTGINDSTGAFKLIDSTADFITDAVTTEMWVRNTDTDFSTKVVSIDNLTTLTLEDDIFPSSAANYAITYYDMDGVMAMNVNVMEKGTGGVGYFRQEVLTHGQFYQVSIDITSFESYALGSQISLKIGGNTVMIIDDVQSDATGTKTFYGVADGTDSLAVEIYADANLSATFANFKIYQSSNIVFFILNCEDDEIVYASEFSDIIQTGTNQLKLSVDWANVGDGYTCNNGCYYIGGVADVGIPINLMLERFNNNNFDSATDWVLGAGWSITSGSAVVVAGGAPRVLEQNNLANNFSSGLSYTIMFQLSAYTSGNATLELFNGTTLIYSSGFFSAQPSGLFTINTGILTDNCDVMKFTSTANANYAITYITAYIDIDFSDVGLRTDCFKVAESHECTVKLSGTNLDNAFGINFASNFYNPFVRVQGQLRTPTYEDDSEVEEDSLGVNRMIYFNSNKIYTLHLYQLPEYLHDFIRLLKGYDTFLIDGEQYFPTDKGYKPDWVVESNKVLDLANVEFNVKQKTELNKNKYC